MTGAPEAAAVARADPVGRMWSSIRRSAFEGQAHAGISPADFESRPCRARTPSSPRRSRRLTARYRVEYRQANCALALGLEQSWSARASLDDRGRRSARLSG